MHTRMIHPHTHQVYRSLYTYLSTYTYAYILTYAYTHECVYIYSSTHTQKDFKSLKEFSETCHPYSWFFYFYSFSHTELCREFERGFRNAQSVFAPLYWHNGWRCAPHHVLRRYVCVNVCTCVCVYTCNCVRVCVCRCECVCNITWRVWVGDVHHTIVLRWCVCVCVCVRVHLSSCMVCVHHVLLRVPWLDHTCDSLRRAPHNVSRCVCVCECTYRHDYVCICVFVCMTWLDRTCAIVWVLRCTYAETVGVFVYVCVCVCVCMT